MKSIGPVIEKLVALEEKIQKKQYPYPVCCTQMLRLLNSSITLLYFAAVPDNGFVYIVAHLDSKLRLDLCGLLCAFPRCPQDESFLNDYFARIIDWTFLTTDTR